VSSKRTRLLLCSVVIFYNAGMYITHDRRIGFWIASDIYYSLYRHETSFWNGSFQLVSLVKKMVSTKVARFFLVQHTKTGKIYQMTTKYTKWP
jgi:hypothetical protein